MQDVGEDGKPKVNKDGKPVFVQDTWADDAKTPKVDKDGKPIWKTQDKIDHRGRSEIEPICRCPPALPWAIPTSDYARVIRSRTRNGQRSKPCWARTASSSRWASR